MSPRTICFCLLATIATSSSAKPPFLRVFLDTYHIQPNSSLGRARCMICHQPPGPPRLGLYGAAVRSGLEAAHVRMLTPNVLKAIEKKGAGDGVRFIAKIKRDQLPGQLRPAKGPKKMARLDGSVGLGWILAALGCLGPCAGRIAR